MGALHKLPIESRFAYFPPSLCLIRTSRPPRLLQPPASARLLGVSFRGSQKPRCPWVGWLLYWAKRVQGSVVQARVWAAGQRRLSRFEVVGLAFLA